MTKAQIGINTPSPSATLDIVSKPGTPAGIIPPRLTADDLASQDSNFGNNQNGAIVFVTTLANGPITDKTKNITVPGYYYFSASDDKWIGISTGTEPWYNSQNSLPATANTQSIYHTGQVALGSSLIDSNAQLDVSSNTKGALLPRLTTIQRDAMPATLANGLLIYNITTNCFNYFATPANKWLSLCGTYEPSKFDLINCSSPTGPQGTYKKGSTMVTNNNIYLIVLNVTATGPYNIILRTSNGYSFEKSGNFTQTGAQNVILQGQGTPTNGPQTDNIVSVEFNGIQITPSCALPSINVTGNTTSATINCASATPYGNYSTAVPLDSSNYIEVPVTSVPTSGTMVVETPLVNGIKFSSGSIVVTSSTTSIKLYGQGTPSSSGTNSYSFSVPGSSPCAVNIAVTNSIGTFANPANKCLEIKNENAAATDGYYWIKDTNNNKFKTYCDMSNGGWTLVNSRSERQMIVLDRTQNMSLASMSSKNPVTTLNGVFNEYNFSVSSSIMNNIGNTSGNKQIRIVIKQKGSTGNTATQVESSTISPTNDIWAKENYWNITIYGGPNPYTEIYTADLYTSEGKIFNFPLKKPYIGTVNYNFNGQDFIANPPGFYSYANFFTGFYGALGYVSNINPSNNLNYVYTSDISKSFTFNKYYINDLFGLYLNTEYQLNHHIGTCSNSNDDYGGASYCIAGWNNWRPHNFNLKDGNYEGRILQYYVK